MSGEEYALITREGTNKDAIVTYNDEEVSLLDTTRKLKRGNETKRAFFWKIPKYRLVPNLNRVSQRLRKMSCISKAEDDDPWMPMDVPRHKSIDIGVGLARRVSLFIFTRRSVCVHPYHPYTPKQTTRKIYVGCDNKHKNS